MGTLFTLDASLKSVITAALDDLITELGKDCLLVYPPRWVACSNCVYDSVNQRSGNTWKSGGPAEFSTGSTCPLCNGHGKMAQEVSESIRLLCAYEPKGFFYPVPNLPIRLR
jgi:hypothetical protein